MKGLMVIGQKFENEELKGIDDFSPLCDSFTLTT